MWEDEEKYDNVTEQPEVAESKADISVLQKELDEARQKAEEHLNSWQRAQADFTNIRRRLEQDKAEAIKYAESDLILKLLLVLDDLGRAMHHTPPALKDEAWVQGMEGIIRKFKGIMDAVGLVEIPAMGLAFDPNLHEAVACLPGPEGTIIAEHEKGYYFKDRILRPSRVTVGSGEPAEEQAE